MGVYSIVFKVPTCREEIGDILDMYSANHGILPNKLFFRKKRKILVSEGKIVFGSRKQWACGRS